VFIVTLEYCLDYIAATAAGGMTDTLRGENLWVVLVSGRQQVKEIIAVY